MQKQNFVTDIEPVPDVEEKKVTSFQAQGKCMTFFLVSEYIL